MTSKRAEPRIYRIGGTWGAHAEWMRLDSEPRRVTGHHTPPPRNGDLLHSPMESGNIGVFALGNVEVMSDPRDQWFADAEWVGYESKVTIFDDYTDPVTGGALVFEHCHRLGRAITGHQSGPSVASL